VRFEDARTDLLFKGQRYAVVFDLGESLDDAEVVEGFRSLEDVRRYARRGGALKVVAVDVRREVSVGAPAPEP
jgi:hypothetical protein